jgi:hypothetical protein
MIHWRVSNEYDLPFKCTMCGSVYVRKRVVKYCFFLTQNEIAKLNVNLLHCGQFYDLKEVRFMSLKMNHTITPYFRYSIARLKREKWLCDRMFHFVNLQKTYDNFFNANCLLRTVPFQSFLIQNSCLKGLNRLIQNSYQVIPIFFELYCELTEALEYIKSISQLDETVSYPSKVWIALQDNQVNVHSLHVEYALSIALDFVNPAVYSSTLRRGLSLARKAAFHTFKVYYPELKLCDRLSNVHFGLYTDFLSGEKSIIEIVQLIQVYQEKKRRENALHAFMLQRGIASRNVQCHAIHAYIEKNALSLERVYACIVSNHFTLNSEAGRCFTV